MYISTKDWKNYIERLSALDRKAGELMQEWIRTNGFGDTKAMIDYAYAVATKYGEGSASLSAAMYDAIAEVSGKVLEAAEVAATPTYGEVAKTVNGTLKHSQNPNSVSNAVSRLVKRTGADTMLKNAERDRAQFAWVPNGDTCAFCIALASRGWQYISKKSWKNGHAEHIHANCDCTYVIRFDEKSSVAGYDPEKYEEMYYGAEGDTPQEKINSLRRMRYAEHKDVINAQKREAYARKAKDFMKQEESRATPPLGYEHNFTDFQELNLSNDEKEIFKRLQEISKRDGYEYGTIVKNGIAGDFKTSNDVNKVLIPDEEITQAHSSLFHTHTGKIPLSAADLRRLLNQNVDKVGVVTYNGDVFTVEIGDGWRPTLEEFIEDEAIIRQSVDIDMMEQAYLNNWSPDELTYMCIREQLYRMGIRYGWKVEGGLL